MSQLQTVAAVAMPSVVQIRERGQFTIPAEIRRDMGVREGDVFSLIRLGDTLVATRKRLMAVEIAKTIESIMQEQGITLEDLLAGLEDQRTAYVREKYGISA